MQNILCSGEQAKNGQARCLIFVKVVSLYQNAYSEQRTSNRNGSFGESLGCAEKKWGFLFTCLFNRGVHVETVTYVETSSCVMVVERFVSRRGTPVNIWSDNGTNFVGAKEEF